MESVKEAQWQHPLFILMEAESRCESVSSLPFIITLNLIRVQQNLQLPRLANSSVIMLKPARF